jgi:hypothetical protein
MFFMNLPAYLSNVVIMATMLVGLELRYIQALIPVLLILFLKLPKVNKGYAYHSIDMAALFIIIISMLFASSINIILGGILFGLGIISAYIYGSDTKATTAMNTSRVLILNACVLANYITMPNSFILLLASFFIYLLQINVAILVPKFNAIKKNVIIVQVSLTLSLLILSVGFLWIAISGVGL